MIPLVAILVIAFGTGHGAAPGQAGSSTPSITVSAPPNPTGAPTSIDVGGVATDGVSAFGAAWLVLPHQSVVERVDLTTGTILASISLEKPPTMLSADAQSVWALTSDSVARIDLSSNEVTLSVPVSRSTLTISTAGGRLFVADSAGTVTAFDASTGEQLASTDVVQEPDDLVASTGAVGVSDFGAGVYMLNPTDLSVIAKVPIPGYAGLAYGNGFFWMTSSSFGTLAKVDAQGNIVDTIQVTPGTPPSRVFYPIATDRSVWVFLGDIGLVEINPKSDVVMGETHVPYIIAALVDPATGQIWTMDGGKTILVAPQPSPTPQA